MTLYHYTTNSAFIQILTNKTLRLTDLYLSNDSLEGKWVREIFYNACKDSEFSVRQLHWASSIFSSNLEKSYALGFCMSKDDDSLSQWRGYADNGMGVAIGFNEKFLKKLILANRDTQTNLTQAELKYDLDNQKKAIMPYIDNISIFLNKFDIKNTKSYKEELAIKEKFFYEFLDLFTIAFTMKNPAFSEEKEVRLICPILDETRHYNYENFLSNFGFLEHRSHIAPYIDFSFKDKKLAKHSSPIDEIVIGPANTTPERIMSMLLNKHGFGDSKIWHSTASYRIL